MSKTQTIALIGTGLMGTPMGHNLLKAGFALRVWNRSPEKTESLVAAGATAGASIADAVGDADFVLSMLSDGVATGGVIEKPDVRAALSKQTVWLDMSSIKPEEARAQSSSLQKIGVGHLDAPVSGGTKGAIAGTLAIMVGGTQAVFEQARPVFEAMGRPVLVGPSGTGQLSKLANQTIVAVTIGAVAEAMLLAERGGADPAAVRAALAGGFADSIILQQHGKRMSEGDFKPGGLSKLQLKDLDNVLAEAGQLGLGLPVTQHIRDRFAYLCDELGGADMDHSALYLELKHQNKL